MDPAGDVEWNFEKFLVGKDGTVIARFKSGVTPKISSRRLRRLWGLESLLICTLPPGSVQQ